MPTDYLDISVPISPDMLVWSTHERVSMDTDESTYAGERNRVTTLRLTTHTGTHVDAPYHFLKDGPTVDQLDLDALIGRAAVYDFRGRTAITAEMLARAGVGSVPRLGPHVHHHQRRRLSDRRVRCDQFVRRRVGRHGQSDRLA